MRITDLNRAVGILPSVVELVEQVEMETGKPIEIRVDQEMKVPATVKIARERMAYHLIRLHPAQLRTMSYLVANKCANILRMARTEPSERMVPVSTAESMQMVRGIINGQPMTEQVAPSTVDFWISVIINQLTNLPVQIHIERWVYATYPNLRDQQKDLLEEDIEMILAAATEKEERSKPPVIFNASNAMTYAFVRGVGEIFGTNYSQPYNNFPAVSQQGKRLYELVGTEDEGTTASDVKIVDKWAEDLGVKEWFAWRNFEMMPESYFADVM